MSFFKNSDQYSPVSVSISLFIASFALSSCGKPTPTTTRILPVPLQFVEGSFIAQVAPDADIQNIRQNSNQLADDLGCQSLQPKPLDWETKNGVLPQSMFNTIQIKLIGCNLDTSDTIEVVEKIAGFSDIDQVGAEALASIRSEVPVEPYQLPWQHRGEFNGADSEKACEFDTGSESEVIVAVLDTGVDLDHPDLQDVFYRDRFGEIIGRNFVTDAAGRVDDSRFDDENGHGTHVAGLIAGSFNARRKTAGIARCTPVKIMPIRILDEDGVGPTSAIALGVQWAIEHGADIINLSLGHEESLSANPRSNRFSSSLFNLASARRVAVFAAAGNSGKTNGALIGGGRTYHFPSSYDNVIGVASTNTGGRLAPSSVRGEKTDIAVPGVAVKAAYYERTWSTLTGTSMAAGVASGVYALALSKTRSGLDSTRNRMAPETIIKYMNESSIKSVHFSSSDVQSNGIVSALKLVENISRDLGLGPVEVTDPDPVVSNPTFQEPVTTKLSFAGLVDGQNWDINKIKIENVPEDTKYVYLYWGGDKNPFARLKYSTNGTSAAHTLETSDRWYLFGQHSLQAIAVNSNVDVLGIAQVSMVGKQ